MPEIHSLKSTSVFLSAMFKHNVESSSETARAHTTLLENTDFSTLQSKSSETADRVAG